MATKAAGERVFNMAGHVFNSRRAKLKSSSVNDILFFNSAFKAKKDFKVDQKVPHLYVPAFLKSFCWSLNEPLTKLPLAMKHTLLIGGFQTHSDKRRCGAKAGRELGRCAGGSELNGVVTHFISAMARRTLINGRIFVLKAKSVVIYFDKQIHYLE